MNYIYLICLKIPYEGFDVISAFHTEERAIKEIDNMINQAKNKLNITPLSEKWHIADKLNDYQDNLFVKKIKFYDN